MRKQLRRFLSVTLVAMMIINGMPRFMRMQMMTILAATTMSQTI